MLSTATASTGANECRGTRGHPREAEDEPGASPVPGVYGLQLRGVHDESLLSRVDRGAPVLTISVERGEVTNRHERFDEDGAEIRLMDGGWVSLSRSGHALFTLPHAVSEEELLHPWLVPAAATFNGWQGRQVLHGGAFARGGRAVAVIGDKEDGKSSLLAWLSHLDGVDILADDLLVIDHGRLYAGPRCIDLRPDATRAVPASASQRLVRDASRLRLTHRAGSSTATLAAIVSLSWGVGDDVTLRRLPPAQGLATVLPHSIRAAHSERMLDLLDIPTWSLVRPRRWGTMDEVAHRLCGLLIA